MNASHVTAGTGPTATEEMEPRPSARHVIPAVACAGVVVDVQGATLSVRCGHSTHPARRAASCLLEPCVGDTVACQLVAPGELWVLAVLERESEGPDVLVSERHLVLRASAVTIEGAHLTLRADEATVAFDRARIAGREWVVVGQAFKLIGKALSSVFERVTHHAQHYLRSTEGTDRVQAMHIECEADQLLRLSGEHTLVNGDKLVKARGAQIHFG